MWKNKGLQLVMLPTDNESKLSLDDYGRLYLGIYQKGTPLNQHVYLLSDEEIKEGDIILTDENSIEMATGLYGNFPYDLINEVGGQRKVIASTDPSLNLPQFPPSFIEEYVTRYNSKKSLEVEVEYTREGRWNWGGSDHICDVWILNSEDNTISIRFKEEKMYSRSEVETLCEKAFYAGEAYRTGSCEGFKQIHPNKHDWIKENLK